MKIVNKRIKGFIFTFLLCIVSWGFIVKAAGMSKLSSNIHTVSTSPISASYISTYPDNLNDLAEFSEYAFVGKVSVDNGTTYENKVPIRQKDGTVKMIGDTFSHYNVEVIKDLKNNLSINSVSIKKFGGIREDLSGVDLLENDELPQLNTAYLFMASKQEDGKLLVIGAHSNTEINDTKIIEQLKIDNLNRLLS